LSPARRLYIWARIAKNIISSVGIVSFAVGRVLRVALARAVSAARAATCGEEMKENDNRIMVSGGHGNGVSCNNLYNGHGANNVSVASSGQHIKSGGVTWRAEA